MAFGLIGNEEGNSSPRARPVYVDTFQPSETDQSKPCERPNEVGDSTYHLEPSSSNEATLSCELLPEYISDGDQSVLPAQVAESESTESVIEYIINELINKATLG